jgi:hypothetical protein
VILTRAVAQVGICESQDVRWIGAPVPRCAATSARRAGR